MRQVAVYSILTHTKRISVVANEHLPAITIIGTNPAGRKLIQWR